MTPPAPPTRERRRTLPLAGGVWGVLATPFADDLDLDAASLVSQVAHYRRIGATGVVALGVFGEAASLSAQEKTTVLETVAANLGSLSLVAGLATRATPPAVEEAGLAVRAAGSSLAALMVQVHSRDPGELAAHWAALHETAGVGIVAQDYPTISGITISPVVLSEAIATCPFVVAVKSESPPTSIAVGELTSRLPVPVFGGLGGVNLLDELASGAAGAMTGFSYPEGLVAAVTASVASGGPAARDAFAPFLPLANFEAQPGIGLAIRKESLRRRGIVRTAQVRPPNPPFPPALSARLDEHLSYLAAGA